MFHRCIKLYLNNSSIFQSQVFVRCNSTLTKAEVKKKRNEIFNEIKKQQRAAIGRIEKIDVKYSSPTEDITFSMNKHISTPHHCAKHISEGVMNVSALALVDDQIWDMHRPFTDSCTLKFLTLKKPTIPAINTAFWRTCSLMLGAVVESAFKDNITVHLHSFPIPIIQSGSFIYDVYIELPDWKPTEAELRAMSALFVQLSNKQLPIERLETTEAEALQIFEDNPCKSQQIPDIVKENDKVILYRIGDHIDISKGPMVGNTNLIGRCSITAVHSVKSRNDESLYRFQGVAIPKGILINHFAYSILENRAKKLNDASHMPYNLVDDLKEHMSANM